MLESVSFRLYDAHVCMCVHIFMCGRLVDGRSAWYVRVCVFHFHVDNSGAVSLGGTLLLTIVRRARGLSLPSFSSLLMSAKTGACV